ncbi:MAG: carboxypeptidase-like regulatory domain-containing protein [Crocinitomicaceae bacterium]|nr:carboxypeptidase-like regulatory domain-containing protein [Crocinitomicaceae bacterium]
MRFRLSILILLFYSTVSTAQKTKVFGVVSDDTFGEPLPGVIIKFKGTKIGTTADMEGNYVMETYYASDTLEVSYPTFVTQYFKINKDESQRIDVILKEAVEGLPTITVIPVERENPAHSIMRQVISNKKINNREKLDAYQYEVYNKIELDLNNIDSNFTQKRWFKKFDFIFDNIDTTERKPYLPVFMTESLSDYYFQREPKKNKEIIKANRVSGVNNESVSQFTGDMYQQVNIYDNHVPVFGKNFVSPVANNGFSYYKYYLLDSVEVDGYWCYHLKFMPKRKGELTFFGDLFVHDTTYAIRRVEGTIAADANINFIKEFKVSQEFSQVEKEVWMLTKDELWIDFNIIDGEMGFYGRKFTSYDNFVINEKKSEDFYSGADNIVVLNDAMDKSDEFWLDNRHDTLSANQKGIFEMMDTLGNVPIVRTYIDVISMLISGWKTVGPISIGPYSSVYSYNAVEGNRFSLGIKTNSQFSEKVELSGYGAYGLLDKKWKYGAGTRLFITKEPRRVIQLVYKSDIEQLGLSQNAFRTDNVLSSFLRRNPMNKLSNIDEFRCSYMREWFDGFSSTLMFRRSQFGPLGIIPAFQFTGNPFLDDGNSITTSEVVFRTRWAHKEQFLSNNFDRVSLGTKKPIITAQFTYGFKGVLDSDYEYQKAIIGWKHKVPLGILGNFKYRFELGKVWGAVPYPLLEIHLGNETWTYNKLAYNMMNISEFVSDEYISASFEHHFDGLLFNKIPIIRKLKWREVATFKAIYGRLSPKHRREMVLPYFTSSLSEKPYSEVSVGIENIFQVFRVDAIWRLSYRDNSFDGIQVYKFGLRCKFQVDF